MKAARFALLSLISTHGLTAFAGLGAPGGISSSAVLPTGISSPRFMSTFGSYDKLLDGTGQDESVAHDINKTIRWTDVLLVQKTDADKAALRQILTQLKINESDSPGNTVGDVKVSAAGFVPTFAYGLSERLTLAIAVPVISVDVRAATGFIKREGPQNPDTDKTAQDVINAISGSGSPVNGNETTNQFANAVDQMTNHYHYKPLRSQSKTAIGDTHIVGKYRLWSDFDQGVAIAGELTAPTGTPPDPDQLIDIPTGDGQWDVGTTVSYDRKHIVGGLGCGAYGSYTYQIADHREMRIPKDGDLLAPDKEAVDRKLGDRAGVGTGLSYEFPKAGITLGTGYHLQYQLPTKFQGTAYEDYRYRRLENDYPSQTLHSLSVSAGYSTVSAYQAGAFVLPLEASLNYGKVLAGRNVADVDRVTAELVVYF